MPKIVSDLSGDLRKAAFYSFELMYDDQPLIGTPAPQSIVAPRNPTSATLFKSGRPDYLFLDDEPKEEERVEVHDCPGDPKHVTLSYYKTLHASVSGGTRLAAFVPTVPHCYVAASEEFAKRLDSLKIRGAKIEPITISDDLHELKGKNLKLWHLQLIGRAAERALKVIGAPNLCPYCGRGKMFCESCGYRIPLCENCGQEMYVIEHNHKGAGDKRIPFERDQKTVLEGKTWDGSDLVQGCYASKRFIDWLLRIHAAPFYAEPVYFCVDGMSDQQWKWLEELQKPFEA
jgi:hypothetical protein